MIVHFHVHIVVAEQLKIISVWNRHSCVAADWRSRAWWWWLHKGFLGNWPEYLCPGRKMLESRNHRALVRILAKELGYTSQGRSWSVQMCSDTMICFLKFPDSFWHNCLESLLLEVVFCSRASAGKDIFLTKHESSVPWAFARRAILKDMHLSAVLLWVCKRVWGEELGMELPGSQDALTC